tara:strand:- start:93 stop:773 length:681 start_codon:yes stop_codon:yes gene_type:complete
MEVKDKIGLRTLDVISASCSAFRHNKGFIKKEQSKYDLKYKDSTSNSELLYNHFYSDFKLNITSDDIEEAVEIMDYLKGLTFKAIERELTEFETNVLKLVSSDSITKDKIGISASLPKVYLNKIEQDNWTTREAELSRTSQALGDLNERNKFNANIEFIRYIPRTMSYLITCSVDGKHILKFFHDKSIDKDSNINLEGYVKSQSKGRYHNGIETIINRVKIQGDEK